MSTGMSALAFIPSESQRSMYLSILLTFKSANRGLPRHHPCHVVGALSRTGESQKRTLGSQRGIPAHASRMHRRSLMRALPILARTSILSQHLTLPHANLHPLPTGLVSSPHDPLDRPHARRHPLRHGHRNHLHGPNQLPLRRLRYPHRLRPRLRGHYAQHPRRPPPAARAADVYGARSELGV